MAKKMDDQHYYYETFSGKMLGSKAREALILCEFNSLKPNQSFLEVGCAQGHYLSEALKRTKKVFGVDVVPEFISLAKKTGAKCFVSSAEKLPLPAGKFDFVLCTETLEHVPDWKKAVKEIQRVSKRGAKIVITVPLEKAFFWRAFSLIYPPEKYRGHLNLLSSQEVIEAFAPCVLRKKVFVQSMSQTLNRVLPQREKISMYCFFVFECK